MCALISGKTAVEDRITIQTSEDHLPNDFGWHLDDSATRLGD